MIFLKWEAQLATSSKFVTGYKILDSKKHINYIIFVKKFSMEPLSAG